jgi:hypothetical protein
MAKHCDVCNQDYADELPACPHCAAAKHKATDSAIDLGEGPRIAPATGDAAGAEPAPLSGTSNVQWASLVEEPGAEEVKVDSPSDADLLAHGAAEPAQAAGEKGEPSASDSAVDLGASPVEIIEEGSRAESDVFVAELASDPNKVALVEEPEAELVAEEVKPGQDDGGRDLIAEAVESGDDPTRPEAELAEEVALDAVEVEDHSSAVDLGAPPRTSHPEMSVVPPEEVVDVPEGSGIDLKGLPVLSSASSGSGSETSSGPRSPTESSVDLGSQEDVSLTGALDDSGKAAVSSHSGIDVGEMKESALVTGSDSDLSDLPSTQEGAAPAEEDAATVEAEVDSLLADLEQTPAGAAEPAAIAAEEEAHQAAEEETAAARANETAKPAKPSKPRPQALALSGASAAGLVLGILGTLGVQMIGGGGDSGKKTASIPGGPQPQPQAQIQTQAPTFADRLGHVRNGDFAKAAESGIEQIQEDKPEELAARGSYRLGAYLQKTGLKVNLQDPPLQQAVTDLQKAAEAKNADAIYDLGLINELANKLPEARKEYTKGINDFPNDPVQKRRFQAALDRLELKEAVGAAAGAMLWPQRNGLEDRVAVLALLLVGLQQAPAPAPGQAPAAEEDEAGYDFWQAAKLARQRKFADAVTALDKARSIHDQRRFTRLRKAQNPLSDPTEDIFLRCCDELKAYWQLEAGLREGGYLTDKNTAPQALNALVQQAQSGGAATKDLADKLIMEKIISRPEDLPKGIDRVLADKKAAEKQSAELGMQLKKAADDYVAMVSKLKKADMALMDLTAQMVKDADREMKLKEAHDALRGTLEKITDDLATAKLLAAGDQARVPEAVRKAIDLAKAKDPQGEVRKLQDEAARATAALSERWRPAELMPVWVLLLEQNRESADLANKALRDAERVKADSSATPAQKGQAQLVRGLALRNTAKFAEAKSTLESARSMLDKGESLAVLNAALKDVSDPAAYYAVQAEMLYAQDRMSAALDLLARTIPALPAKDQARLLAQRSLIELDAARSKNRGALPPGEPLLADARKDADEAAKAGVAEGHYAAGRIAEVQGQWNAAAQSYRKALEGHPALDAEGSRYRMALARVLLQPPAGARPGDRAPAPVPAPPAAGGNKVGWSDPAPYPARTFGEMRRLALMVVLGLQAPLPPGDQPDAAEAEKLADEVLRAPEGSVPFNVRAQALAIKGRWTQALRLYADGIRLFLPPEYRDGLLFLILNHPRLNRPDNLRVANPFEAEKHFAAGVNLYFDCDFVYAEKELLLAVENDGQDARYYYFLGLARLAQNKRREAYRDFEEGAMLEQLNRPSPAAVSEALERIQGPTRILLNDVRDRPER